MLNLDFYNEQVNNLDTLDDIKNVIIKCITDVHTKYHTNMIPIVSFDTLPYILWSFDISSVKVSFDENFLKIETIHSLFDDEIITAFYENDFLKLIITRLIKISYS